MISAIWHSIRQLFTISVCVSLYPVIWNTAISFKLILESIRRVCAIFLKCKKYIASILIFVRFAKSFRNLFIIKMWFLHGKRKMFRATKKFWRWGTKNITWWILLPNIKRACRIFGSDPSRHFKRFKSTVYI